MVVMYHYFVMKVETVDNQWGSVFYHNILFNVVEIEYVVEIEHVVLILHIVMKIKHLIFFW